MSGAEQVLGQGRRTRRGSRGGLRGEQVTSQETQLLLLGTLEGKKSILKRTNTKLGKTIVLPPSPCMAMKERV